MSTESTDVQFEEEKTQSVRLNPNDRAALARIIENSDEWGNASAALRGLIREADEQASDDGGPPRTGGRAPPTEDDLADAWRSLKRLTKNGDSGISRDLAESHLAQTSSLNKKAVYHSLLRPLNDRGYIRINNDPMGRNSRVRVFE